MALTHELADELIFNVALAAIYYTPGALAAPASAALQAAADSALAPLEESDLTRAERLHLWALGVEAISNPTGGRLEFVDAVLAASPAEG